MHDNTKHIEIKKHRTLFACQAALQLCFFLFLSFLSRIVYAGTATDTLLQKQLHYDLNDPRNPDCPCHNYQKLAEEEYTRKNKQPENNKIVKTVTEKTRTDREKKETDSIYQQPQTTQIKEIVLEMPVNTEKEYTSKEKNIMFLQNNKTEQENLVGKIRNRKKRLWIAKIKFRFICVCRKLQKSKAHPDYRVCFKWN